MRFPVTVALIVLASGQLGAFDPANQDDSQALVRHFEPRPNPLGSPIQQGSFDPGKGETISLMGGAEVFQMQDSGSFELILHRAYPDRQLKVRNLGWPADTVYRQQRPMYFYTAEGDTQKGSIADSREKVAPGTFLLQFGKVESLDGLDALDGFVSSYEALLQGLAKVSRRIVLVQPSLYSNEGPAGALAEERNNILSLYREKIREIAVENQFAVVDSFTELVPTRIASADVESLRAAILRKNHLWDQYYRPTNWAFLFGDRQHVPSSRDHRDANRRWFVEEIDKLPALIAEQEEMIWNLAGGGENE